MHLHNHSFTLPSMALLTDHPGLDHHRLNSIDLINQSITACLGGPSLKPASIHVWSALFSSGLHLAQIRRMPIYDHADM